MPGSRSAAAPGHAWRDLLQKFRPFCAQAVFEHHEAGRVAAWPRQTIDEAGADRVGVNTRGSGGLEQRPHDRAACSQDDVGRESDEFRRELSLAGRVSRGPADVDAQIAPLDPTQHPGADLVIRRAMAMTPEGMAELSPHHEACKRAFSLPTDERARLKEQSAERFSAALRRPLRLTNPPELRGFLSTRKPPRFVGTAWGSNRRPLYAAQPKSIRLRPNVALRDHDRSANPGPAWSENPR